MSKQAFVVIDLQNDVTKHYKDVIDNVNSAIRWASSKGMVIVYIKHENTTDGTRTFKRDTKGFEFVSELNVVSDNVFVKTKSNALTSEQFVDFIKSNDVQEFFVVGADATACVKSTTFNMRKEGYPVTVLSNCVTSYDLKKIPEMLTYYESKGCKVCTLSDLQ